MTLTISPASTSLKKVAPTISKAHVSEANTYAPLAKIPIDNGLRPYLSLTAYSRSSISIKKAKAPSNFSNALQIRSIICPSCLLIRCPNTSVSDVEEKILPFSSSSFFSTLALTRFPL